MAEITVIPLLNAQEQSMAPLAASQATRPEAAQAITQQNAHNVLREQAEQVQKPEDSAKSNLVSSDDGSAGEGFAGGSPRERKRSSLQEEETEALPCSSDPLVGNLLNVKV